MLEKSDLSEIKVNYDGFLKNVILVKLIVQTKGKLKATSKMQRMNRENILWPQTLKMYNCQNETSFTSRRVVTHHR